MRRLLLSFTLLLVSLSAAGPLAAHARNAKPVAVKDNARTPQGQPVLIDVLANDTDADGDTLLVVSLTQAPKNGSAVIVNATGRTQVYYAPFTGFKGNDTIKYKVSDGHGGEATGTITVTVFQIKPPVAKDETVTVFSHKTLDIDVLANDSDADGDSLRIVDLPAVPAHGTAEILHDEEGQRVHYAPNIDFEGLDSFSYVIEDLDAATDTAKVFINVLINRPPEAADDSVTLFMNASLDIDVLAGDTDREGDTLTVLTLPVPPLHGRAAIVGGGTRVSYTPDPGFLGEDRFEYTLSDGLSRGGSLIADRATVTVRVLPPDRSFEAVLTGAGAVPATSSRASGLVIAAINDHVLTLSGTFSLLESDFNEALGANLYVGAAGQSGDVLLPLKVSLSAGKRSGVFNSANNTFVLTDAEREALFTRKFYVSIPTMTMPDGAIRGQLLPAEPTALYRAVLSGRAEVPANRSGAVGGAMAERYDHVLVVTGAFKKLASDFRGGAHLHRGDLGSNGSVLFDLTATPDADGRGGTFERGDNVFTLTDAQVQLLDEGLLYLNVGTVEAPGGEIRGQLLPLSTHVFEASLAGAGQTGSGGILARLDGTTLTLSGSFGGLTSGVDLSLRNGAHLHLGAPGEGGALQFELAPVLDADGRGGFFTGGSNRVSLSVEQLNALFEGALYLDVHTLNHPDGALRGQLLPSTNLAPSTSSLSSPADGAAVDVTGNPNAPFAVRWFPGIDANGNAIYYRWQLALDPAFETVIFESPSTTATAAETTLGAIHAALADHGAVPGGTVTAYLRVIASDGSLETPGPVSRVVLGDETATGVAQEAVPEQFAVLGNYPNPFNPATTVQIDLPQAARVRVELFDLLGRRVLETPPQHLAAGARRAVALDAGALASGIYLYRVVALADGTTFTGTGRMTLVK